MRFVKQVHHVALAMLFAISLWPAPTAEAQSTLHAPWDSLLKAHVRQGLVDYDALERAPALPRYLASLDTVTVEALDENERLAFWINAYNAYTIQLILTHHERQSIRNINRSLGLLQLKGPWNERLVKAGGKVYTLDEVFHRVLRKQFREPRMHFAVVPASKGAPPLRSEAYTGAQLEAQLEDQTRRLLSDTAWTWYRKGVLGVNEVMLAYERDFAASRPELVQFVAPYVTLRPNEEQKTRLKDGKPPVLVLGRPYDWTLNAQSPARPTGAPASLPRPR